ncbi:MAG: efflux RND transporter periplasmic adaptor subunit [Syntrophorhabdales bacterium]|jgi:membrane fusion protein (multidrug efflux system)
MQIKYGRIVVCGLGVLAMFLMVAACGKSKAGGPSQGGAPEVAVVVLQPERVALTMELPGRTSPLLVAEVRPQVSGIIKKRLFIEGSDVKAGDLLYQIDPAMYEAARDSAGAGLSRAEANMISIRAKMERYKELVTINAVSRQDYDDATAALQQAKADIEGNKAALDTARINLAYTRVTAPITGRIGRSNVTVGALATANQSIPFATIQQLDPIYVDVTQSSANLLQLQRNMAAGRIQDCGPNKARVKLLLEDGAPYPFEGSLKFSDVTVDPSTGSFILRIVVPNPRHMLLPGMYVRAAVQEGVVDRAILVPQQGVSRDPKGNPVALVVDGSGKVEQRMITVDRAFGDRWLVIAGLAAGDRVIVEGSQRVQPGASVKVAPFDAGRKDGPGAVKAAQGPVKAN